MPEFRQLLDGYDRFKSGPWVEQRRRYEALAGGQAPPVMVIACSDSRVDPAAIFDTEPGQMFALRNVAALVPPYELGGGLHGVSSALEFGVVNLGVRHVVVMAHEGCSGCAAALSLDEDAPPTSFIDRWVGIAAPARQAVLEAAAQDALLDRQRAMELATVRLSLANLRSFPFVREREEDGRLKLHGTWFAIASGELLVLDEAAGAFGPS